MAKLCRPAQIIVFVLCLLALADENQGFVLSNPIESGYGAPGPWKVVRDSISAGSRAGWIHLFRPVRGDTAWPTLFFCHGIGSEHPRPYIELLHHLASRGHAVLYAPYLASIAVAHPPGAYAMIQKGFERGVDRWGAVLDSTRIGVIGHSYGGGMAPAVAWKWLTERRWGRDGAAMFIMAPWYSYNISQRQLERFPDSVTVVMQVYADDAVNDHRMAKDIFDNIGVDKSRKNFIVLYSDSSRARTLLADHGVPTGAAAGGRLDELDYFGVWRLIDAACAYGMHGDSSARTVALGSGNESQKFMGFWENGRAVRELSATHTSLVLHPQSAYVNFWNHRSNPRFERITYFNALPFWRERQRFTLRNYLTLRPGEQGDTLLAPHSSPGLRFAPIDSGFGADGAYQVRKRDFPHPGPGHGKIYLFSPQGAPGPRPVIVFLHGFQWPMPDFYRGLITHVASRGSHVIFPSYMLFRTTVQNRKRYDLMATGVEEAMTLLGAEADTTRVGFIGHSYGGGAIPALAHRYLAAQRWGTAGAFLFIMAPWYVYYADQNTLDELPAHTKMIVQVYENERFNDWRMGEDLFYSCGSIPSANKAFMVVHSDRYGDERLEAEHVSPLSSGEDDVDAIDFWAIYRMADALAACSFEQDHAGCEIALGNGMPRQIEMGRWPDGEPVTPMMTTNKPVTPYAKRSYLFPWNRPWNKRRRHYKPRSKAER